MTTTDDMAVAVAAADDAFAVLLTEASEADMDRSCPCGSTGRAAYRRARDSQDVLLGVLDRGAAPAPTDAGTDQLPSASPGRDQAFSSTPGLLYGELLAREVRAAARQLHDALTSAAGARDTRAVRAHVATMNDLAVQLAHLLGFEA